MHVFSERFKTEGDQECLESVRYSTQKLSELDIRTKASSHTSLMEQHPPFFDNIAGSATQGQFLDFLSAFSTVGWFHLERCKWYRMPVSCKGIDGCELESQPTMRKFHGTVYGNVLKIVAMSQGFIAGEGTHAVNGKPWSGCWCVDDLGNAILRCNSKQYSVDNMFDRLCCPMVLELQAAHVRRVPGSTMHCVPGKIGEVVQGLTITAVHVNVDLLRNYMQLERVELRRRILSDPFRCRVCACGLCGTICTPDSAEWYLWTRSNNGHYYNPRCGERVRNKGPWLTFG